MTVDHTEDSDIDDESLQLDYDELCDEVVELQQELRAANIEKQQLQMRLKAVAVHSPNAFTVVSNLPPAGSIDPRLGELENFVMWLAEHVNLDQSVILDVGLEVPIANRAVQLNLVVQWPLTFALGRHLQLTAPLECKDQLQALLTSAKEDGKVSMGSLQTLASYWDLVPGDLETITQKAPEPVVMLTHKFSTLGILVATWPTAGALEAFRALCSVDGEPFQLGQRVEVEYDGQWYVGTLHSLTATGKASVSCDVDGPGVLTVAPVYRVRRHGEEPKERAHSDAVPQTSDAEPEEAPADEQGLQRSQSEGQLTILTKRPLLEGLHLEEDGTVHGRIVQTGDLNAAPQ